MRLSHEPLTRSRRGGVTAAEERCDPSVGSRREDDDEEEEEPGDAGRDLVGEAGGCAVEADAHATSSATLASWARRSRAPGRRTGSQTAASGAVPGSRDAVATGTA